jgi:hypothetical protein
LANIYNCPVWDLLYDARLYILSKKSSPLRASTKRPKAFSLAHYSAKNNLNSNLKPMKNNKFAQVLLLALLILLSSCGNKDEETENVDTVAIQSEVAATKDLQTEFLGNYHGIQPSYFMKNQYGDDMVINGSKVPVPSIDYKFLLKEDNAVSLQQINLEDNSRVYYDGTYKIVSEENGSFVIECSLSDGQTSNPIYILTIDKNEKKGICTGTNEPEFNIEISK